MAEQSFEGLASPTDKPESRDVIPECEVTAQITNAEIRDTQKGGKGLNLEWTVLDTEHTGRKLFQWINLLCPDSEQGTKIGRGEYAAVRAGLFGNSEIMVKTPMELLNRPTRIKIGHRKEKDTGEIVNVIRKCTYLGAGVPQTSPAATTQQAPNPGGWA